MSDNDSSSHNEKTVKSDDEKTDKPNERTPRQKRRDRKKQRKKQSKSSAPTFKGATPEIQDHVFVLDPKHRTKLWMNSREAFIDYAGGKFGSDVKTSLVSGEQEIESVPKPQQYTDDEFKEIQKDSPYKYEQWKMDSKEYREAKRKLHQNLGQLYSKLWGQCDTAMRNKIKAHADYSEAYKANNVILLMEIIDDICASGNETSYPPLQQYMINKQLHNFKQTESMTLAEYYQEFTVLVKLAEKAGNWYGTPQLVKYVQQNFSEFEHLEQIEYSDIDEDDKVKLKETGRNIYLAVLLIMNASDEYAIYKQDCHNNYVQGKNDWPVSPEEAYTALDQYKFDPKIYQKRQGDAVNTIAHSFLIDGSQDADSSCYNCGRTGHYARDCRYETREDGTPTKRASTTQDNHTENGMNLVTAGVDANNEAEKDSLVSEDIEYQDELSDDDYKLQIVDGQVYYTEATNQVTLQDYSGNADCAFNQPTGTIKSSWILLDNCSTVNVFSNKDFLKDIHTVKEELHLITNAGKAIIKEKGTLPGIGTIWYHRKGVANILGYNQLAKMKGVHIEYNNRTGDDTFRVYGLSGVTLEFKPSSKGLYHWDPQECNSNIFNQVSEGMNFVETIADNKKKFTERDVKRAEKARWFQQVAGHISDEQLYKIVRRNQLKNCPITPKDIKIMQAIFGPNVPSLKGKTVRRGKPAVQPAVVPLPREVKEHYRKITLGIDVMYINTIPFLTTISRDIHYGTASPLKSTKASFILEVIIQLSKYYRQRDFRVRFIMADGQFKPIENELAARGIRLNCVSNEEHVPEIERYNRTIKERCRAIYHSTPFRKIPKRMLIEMIRTAVFYLNSFPWEGGVSDTLSPHTLVTGIQPDYSQHFQVAFGTYVQARQTTTNTLKPRTIGAIAMGPSYNIQGGVRFFSLVSGEIINRTKNDYTVCPMPQDVIDRVYHMARTARDGIMFKDRDGNDIDDETSHESDYNDDDGSQGTSSSSNSDEMTSDSSDDDQTVSSQSTETTGVGPNETVDNITAHEEDENDPNNEHAQENHEGNDEVINNIQDSESSSDDEDTTEQRSSYGRRITQGNHSRPMDDQFEYQYTQYPQNNEAIHMLTTTSDIDNMTDSITSWNNHKPHIINEIILTQYGLKAGLRMFGEEGKNATMKELRQMLKRDVFVEIEYETLSQEDKQRALPILLFLTTKRDGTVKGRACADGRKQRIWMQKEDSSSPTVAPEVLFYTLVVDAMEGRDVATCDLPGHFLQTDMEERLILRIDGALAKLLVKVDPKKWRRHLRVVGSRPVIYVRCNKAIYGTLNAALLSYKKLIGHLQEWGFEMNPYDPCCWNQTIAGKQMTIVFHVDDLKLSHVDPEVVTKIIEKLESVYATLDPMTKNRGKVHQYLGMTIDFRTPGEVHVSMYDYVQKMIDLLPKDMLGLKPTAAPEHLFKTDGVMAAKLDKERSEIFHSLTAMSLYLGKRARPDLQTPTAFLSTRVRAPDEHDWKKLGHQMKYLQATRFLPLILKSDGNGTAIYIDGAHAVHADMRGHAGAFTTEGTGAVFASSTKCKINTLSSTETEVVSTGEKLPKFVWYRLFRIAQGGNNREDVLYQDNQSAILLNKNGRMSCGKGSKHIAIRYFFITDCIRRGDFRVEYCPTEEMIADYFTKPLQGGLFKRLRNQILGIRDEDQDKYRQNYKDTIKEFGLTDTAKDQ